MHQHYSITAKGELETWPRLAHRCWRFRSSEERWQHWCQSQWCVGEDSDHSASSWFTRHLSASHNKYRLL